MNATFVGAAGQVRPPCRPLRSPEGPASGSLMIAGGARAILGQHGRAVKPTNRSVTDADESRRPVQQRPERGQRNRGGI
jgi:hypothetical protein